MPAEAVHDFRVGSRYSITGGSLGRSDMKTLTTSSQRLVAKIFVERNYSEPIRQRVLDECLVVLGFDSSLSRPNDPMTPPVQE